MKRPTSITVIAWILIAVSGFALVLNTLMLITPIVAKTMAKNPMPMPVHYILMYLGLSLSIVAAFAILKGRNWGRFLYTVWGVIGLAIGVATSPVKVTLIPGTVFFVLIVVFLFLPKANAYFSSGKTMDDAQSL